MQTVAAPVAFDPEKFRQTTRAQWESAAGAWDRWAPLLGRWLGPATEAMLDMAAIGRGARVLDVAAGAGEQTLQAARRAAQPARSGGRGDDGAGGRQQRPPGRVEVVAVVVVGEEHRVDRR